MEPFWMDFQQTSGFEQRIDHKESAPSAGGLFFLGVSANKNLDFLPQTLEIHNV